MLAHKGPSCDTWGLTVGRVESEKCPVLCPNLKGTENKVQYVKPWPRRQFPGDQRSLWKLGPSYVLTQYAVGILGYAQLASSNNWVPHSKPCQAWYQQPNIDPRHSHLQDAASFLARWVLNLGFTSVALVWLMTKLANFKSKLPISVCQLGHEWKY